MNRLSDAGLGLQGLAAGLLLTGGPALLLTGGMLYDSNPVPAVAVVGLFGVNLVLVASALAVQLYVTHWGVITFAVPCGLVLLAPEGELPGKIGVCYLLMLGFVYLWRRWDRWAARAAGVLQVLLVLVASHPPLITHGPSDYHSLVSWMVTAFGPFAPWIQQVVVDGKPGAAAHYAWLGAIGAGALSPGLLQLDVLVDVLRRWRDRVRAREALN